MKTLYRNARFVTMVTPQDQTEALVVADDGTIAYTGSLGEARRLAQGAPEVDLGRATVLPGFIDPHGHFVGSMQYILYADLSACASFQDIQEQLRSFVKARGVGPEGMVMGMGYDQNALVERRHPDKAVLDAASDDLPILIVHASNHMAVANSALLGLAGIDENTPDPEGGRYGRTPGSREPDGYAEEPSALAAFYAVSQKRVKMDLPAIADEMQRIYLEHGITTCQDGATPAASCAALCDLARRGALKIDVVAYPMHGEDVEGMFADYADFAQGFYIKHFRLGGMKMFLDGSPQGLTAWMTEPYTEGPDGERDWVAYGTMSDEDATAFAKEAIDKNRQLLCHANGDAAADQLLRVYAAALEASDNPDKRSLRPVMIHCQTARKDHYERMAQLKMVPSIFASHIWYWGDVHLKNFGPVRGGRISACGDALRAGLPFTLHTDTPVLRPNLLEAAWCAVNRITKEGVQLDEGQKVGVYDALCAITKNGAYQYGEEARKGTLEAGKLADLTVLDRNPLEVDPAELRDLRVLSVVKEGEEVYARPQ